MTESQLEHTRRHDNARFERDDIALQESHPSHGKAARIPGLRTMLRLLRWLAVALLIVALLILLAAGALYSIGVDTLGNERLRFQAERAITQLVGVDVDVKLGELRLGFGEASLLALEVRDAEIIRAENGLPVVEASRLRFGLKAMPLLDGRIEIAQVKLADAVISPAQALAGLGGGGASAPVLRPQALYDTVFGAVRRAFAMTETRGVRRVAFDNISFAAGGDAAADGLTIETLELLRVSRYRIELSGSALRAGQRLAFTGGAERDPASGSVEMLSLAMTMDGVTGDGSSPTALESLDAASLSLSGREGDGGPGWLSLDAEIEGLVVRFDQDLLPLDTANLRVAFARGDEVFSVSASRVASGRSVLNLQGTVTPVAGRQGSSGTYGFHLVSRESVLAPAGSPEPALPYALRMSGSYDPARSRLMAEDIDIRTSGGEVSASLAVTMPAGVSPGVRLALGVADLPTSHAKQFWPWFAATGARKWALENVFGGRVRDSNLRLAVPPGRLGNGVPLSQEEVVGRFALEDTRFDIAGNIPPVRDGSGWVEFRGTDVAVGLSQGTIYMPSGRSVAASNGELTIDAAHLKPRIGQLEIDVAGDASAIVELASYDPIDAARFHDFTPQDVDGAMSGHISADIPLQEDIPAENLDWRVALEFEDLMLAKPIEGQVIEHAAGAMVVEPDRIAFTGEADLNKVPASLKIVEPLGGSAVERVREIELRLDDPERDKLLPGLETLVSGPFEVDYEAQADGRTKLTVALDDARLTVPWIGWTKGPGVPATAEFYMHTDDDTLHLSDFTLTGGTFVVSGAITIVDGVLDTAELDSVKFNREDDYAATIVRSGEDYSVSVSGRSMDVRGVIKRVMDDEEGGGETGESTDVSVGASLETVHGFHGETLGQVEMRYEGGGDTPYSFSAEAAASSRGSMRMSSQMESGRRTVRASSDDAGVFLRFLDIYEHVQGGNLALSLTGPNDTALSGQFDIHDFHVVDEPRMRSLVAASSERVDGEINASRVYFERGSAILSKGRNSLGISEGVVRGPLIGSTFQGTLYDANDNVAITGTFMPIYGFNRIFGEIPIVGLILGNGRDRGLFGITYRLTGPLADPVLEVNPISAIAPGIFRQIFEFR